MSLQSYFPTLIYNHPFSGPATKKMNRDLIRECYQFRELDDSGHAWSRVNYAAGYTSYSSVSDLPYRSTTFEDLQKKIDRHVLKYAEALDMDLQGRKLQMSTCWMNIMGKHCHHSFHLHPLSAISGTYFLQTPKGSGAFKIEDPRISSFMGSPPRKTNAGIENQRYIKIQPRPGLLLLFESWLKHEVPANLSDTDRISISFNYDWIG